LPVPGGNHPAVTTLRTLTDARTLKERLVSGARVGVVGAGLIGAEVTAAAVELGCAVTLIDPAPRPLEHVLGPEIAEAAHAQHHTNGVRVITGAIAAIHDNGDGLRLRLAGSEDNVSCDLIVVGIGFGPDLALATAAGLPIDRGVLVDRVQRTKHARVFAVGDVARAMVSDSAQPSPGHWDAAREHGRIAAAAIVGRSAPTRRAPWFWSERYGTRLEVAGNFLGGDATVIRGSVAAGDFSAFAVRGGHCVGAVTLNRPRDMAAARRLIDRRTTVALGRLVDESADLRTLARP
jgi:NADPH-dependent 2,4-dienoyl-CoA reductase/sulfur reductase-like enzyme